MFRPVKIESPWESPIGPEIYENATPGPQVRGWNDRGGRMKLKIRGKSQRDRVRTYDQQKKNREYIPRLAGRGKRGRGGGLDSSA